MQRRGFLKGAAALGVLGAMPFPAIAKARGAEAIGPESVDDLPELSGELTVYLGRGEGGLYQDVIEAIRERNPDLDLAVRRASSASLANTLVQEHQVGGARADLFWSIDASSLGAVIDQGMTRPVPEALHRQVKPAFRYPHLAPVSGRVRTVAYNPERVDPADLPDAIMAFPDAGISVGWAPAYGAFQSFLTAMRILEGEPATKAWLKGIAPHATEYAGELGAVMAVARGEVDVAFANHYYTLRLKQGKPDAAVDLAFTANDAGSLLNTSGVVLLSEGDLPANFVRYLLTREVQSYLAREAFEIPMVPGVPTPDGLPGASELQPPELALTRLSDMRPTLELMREVGVL
ncbi:extracellular solute-binding protein [Arhodomonas sp. AD133]|uniref:extracellular solute-binding protein n=1 Tax=Arhodomonas sp. AD133 TaxID=3415009 RepID=UPI003EBFAEB1